MLHSDPSLISPSPTSGHQHIGDNRSYPMYAPLKHFLISSLVLLHLNRYSYRTIDIPFILYHFAASAAHQDSPSYMLTWEKELQTIIALVAWERCFLLTHKLFVYKDTGTGKKCSNSPPGGTDIPPSSVSLTTQFQIFLEVPQI